jgi:hypothetical protein
MDGDEKPRSQPEDTDAASDDQSNGGGWTVPERSDQAPGEETVQVNDQYVGGGEPPRQEAHQDDDQHPTGG